MAYTEAQLQALEPRSPRAKARQTFGDKTVEYRSVDELKAAIREVKRGLLQQGRNRSVAGRAAPDPVTTAKGSEHGWFPLDPNPVRPVPVHEAAGRGRRSLGGCPATPARSPQCWRPHAEPAHQEPGPGAPQRLGQAGIEAFVANAVGTGIKPQSLSATSVPRRRVQAPVARLDEEADAAGQTDFYGLQAWPAGRCSKAANA